MRQASAKTSTKISMKFIVPLGLREHRLQDHFALIISMKYWYGLTRKSIRHQYHLTGRLESVVHGFNTSRVHTSGNSTDVRSPRWSSDAVTVVSSSRDASHPSHRGASQRGKSQRNAAPHRLTPTAATGLCKRPTGRGGTAETCKQRKSDDIHHPSLPSRCSHGLP